MIFLPNAVHVLLVDSALIALAYGFLFVRRRDRFLGLWTAAWLILAGQVSLELLPTPPLVITRILGSVLSLANAGLLLAGACTLARRRLARRWILRLVAAAGVVTAAHLAGLPVWARAVTGPASGGLFLFTAWMFLDLRGGGPARWIAALSFVGWALIRLFLPFNPGGLPQPWNVLLPSIFAIGVAVGAILVYLERLAKALAHTESLFQHLADQSRDILVRVALVPSPRLEFVSPAVLEATGYSAKELLATPAITQNLCDPVQLQRLLEGAALGQAELFPMEVRHRDGGTRLLETRLVARRAPSGHLVGVDGVLRDVTDRERAAEGLRRNEALLRSIVDHSSAMIWVKDPDGVYLLANEAFGALVSLPGKRLTGMRDVEIFGPEPAAHHASTDAAVLGTRQPAQSAGTFVTPDGIKRHHIWVKFPLLDAHGVPWAIAGVATDVTAEVEQAAAVRQSERTLRETLRLRDAILDGATYTIISTTANGVVQTFNRAAERLLGYSAAEVIGKVTPLEFHDPDEIRARAEEARTRSMGAFTPTFEALVEEARRGGPHTSEWSYLRKDGSRFPVELVVSALRDEQEVTGYVFIGSDLSQRRRLEAQLLQAQKLEAIGRLAGGVAHDFNNLLTTILGYTDLLAANVPAGPIAEDVGEIRQAAERAIELTQQLLGFARRQIVAPRLIDLNVLIHTTHQLLHRLLGASIDLVVVPSPNLALTRIDPGQFEQILVNLAVNARDAMPTGGKLTIETATVDLDEDHARQRADLTPGRYVLVTISDTGRGIDPEMMHHLFEPFYTTKGPGENAGLGLATCYGIVKQAGGHIWAYSEPDRGTTFKIYLPAAIPATQPAAIAPRPASGAPGGRSILFVEDDPIIRQIGTRALRDGGYDVLEAESAEQAMAVAEEHAERLGAIVTDVVLPGADGPMLAAALVARFPRVPVLLVSGHLESHVAATPHGRDRPPHQARFLAKPYTPQSLREAVAALFPSATEVP